jgi:hypothetical protein
MLCCCLLDLLGIFRLSSALVYRDSLLQLQAATCQNLAVHNARPASTHPGHLEKIGPPKILFSDVASIFSGNPNLSTEDGVQITRLTR